MRKLGIALLALSLFATTANAATLTITADKSSYSLGETITLSIVGDSQGMASHGLGAFLLFDDTRVSWVATDQTALTSYDGALTWILGGVVSRCLADNSADPGCPAIAQIPPSLDAHTVDGLLLATMTLTATQVGIVDFAWETHNPAEIFAFFGLTNAPGTSVAIFDSEPSMAVITPEPGTAGLLAVGLVGIALSCRRQRRAAS